MFLNSLNIYDQHRDMRLDIDNMSYEVSTYLPQAKISWNYFCNICHIYQLPGGLSDLFYANSSNNRFISCNSFAEYLSAVVFTSLLSSAFKQELLDLEERMGTVSTALSEEALTECLNRSIYQSKPEGAATPVEDLSDVKCCICQVSFQPFLYYYFGRF